MAELLLQKKHCAAIGKQIHMIKVKDGEEKEILGHKESERAVYKRRLHVLPWNPLYPE